MAIAATPRLLLSAIAIAILYLGRLCLVARIPPKVVLFSNSKSQSQRQPKRVATGYEASRLALRYCYCLDKLRVSRWQSIPFCLYSFLTDSSLRVCQAAAAANMKASATPREEEQQQQQQPIAVQQQQQMKVTILAVSSLQVLLLVIGESKLWLAPFFHSLHPD